MNSGTVWGIYRERVFSPGKVAADSAVLDASLASLATRGYAVRAWPAESLDDGAGRPAVVLSMAQSRRALNILEAWIRLGTRVVNAVGAVRNCYRRALVARLQGAGICMPRSRMVALESAAELAGEPLAARLWLKRGDVHAVQPGDVACVSSPEELARALDHFRAKHIPDILVQDHVEGRVVKFYGVGRQDYFRAYHSATGTEVTTAVPGLSAAAARAAAAVGLEVYGGDAVLTGGGNPVLIDLNDWPSFSPCCFSAAESIAGYLAREMQVESRGAFAGAAGFREKRHMEGRGRRGCASKPI
jgi:hypothetical protein